MRKEDHVSARFPYRPWVVIKALIAPCLLFITIVSITIVLRFTAKREIDQRLEQAFQDESTRIADLFLFKMKERMTRLEVLALFSSRDMDLDETKLRARGRQVMKKTPGFMAISLTDEELDPIWVESGSNRAMTTPTLHAIMQHPQISEAMARASDIARNSKKFAMTDPINFGGDFGVGFVAIVPVYEGSRTGSPSRFILGLFNHDQLVETILPELPYWENFKRPQLYQIDRGLKPKYAVSAPEPLPSNLWREQAPTYQSRPLGSQMWWVMVEPQTHSYQTDTHTFVTSGAIVTLGTILALVMSLVLYRQQMVALRSQSEALFSRTRLASTSHRLAQIKEELDLILNNVDEGIILYDEEMAPLQANAGFKKAFMLGQMNPDEGMDDSAQEHHRQMASLFQNETVYWTLLNHLRENPEKPYMDEVEYRGVDGDRTRRFYQRRATTVIGPEGSRRGYLVIYQDTTPTRLVEKLKEDFLASVTHDLKTPLASIEGFAETMLRDPAMDQKTRDEFMSIICDESARLKEMIEDLLDLGRMEEGQFDLKPASYNLKALVEDVVRSSKPVLEPNGLEIKIDWGDQPARSLLGDVGKMGRAVRNIINNAIKYSPQDRTIWIKGVEDEDRVQLEVTDEGPGIAPDEIQHVFEKFYRGTKHVRKTKGTGLGLAIVKHIVESHGGIVSIRNNVTRGATIKLVLPRDSTLNLAHLPETAEQDDIINPEKKLPSTPAGIG